MERNLIRKVLQVEGMTCTGCETRIEKALKKIDGVVEVKTIYSSSNVYITYDAGAVDLNRIITAIEDQDYRVKNKPFEERDLIKEKPKDRPNYGTMIGIGIIILALYIIVNNTVGFNFIPEVNQTMGYGLLFTVGLLTSLHCIAMCGGINLCQCVSYSEGNCCTIPLAKLKPSLLYNAGRVISYTLIGGMVGALGSVISFTGQTKGIVAIIAGAFMVIMGLNMLEIFPWLKKINPRMPRFLRGSIENGNNNGPFYVGLLNGFMPCGPLQAMQLYALGTESFAAGALSMFMFSMGTVPLMFGFGALSTIISRKFTHKMMKVSAMLVIILGVVMAGRGMNLSGYNVAFGSSGSGSIARLEDNVQLITTKLQPGSYSPIVVQKGIPVKWTIKAEKSDLNGCNNPITIPAYRIEKKLVPGDNIIEFTPEEEGNIVYTCWMGMISSNIKIVSDITKTTEKDVQQIPSINQPGFSGGCCGG